MKALAVFFSVSLVAVLSSDYIPVIVEQSGSENVGKFATAIHFYLKLTNNGDKSINITVTPIQCCLVIEEGDIDCEVIVLRPPVTVTLGPMTDQFTRNNSGRALFMFRNLYARYRKGNCSFEITDGSKDDRFLHTLEFNTSPKDASNESCIGIDQDQDRGCTPADCAIKYKGRRNFYRNTTGKCEPVVECDTRGQGELEIIAYYDWDSNVCHRLDFEENTFSHVESDTEIPVEIDPSQSEYFPNLEPQRFKDMNVQTKINCNNGIQNGIYCDCDEGWMSSGIHEEDPLTFHWCDTEMVDRSRIPGEPVKLSKPVEIFTIIILLLFNISLSSLWGYLVYILFLKARCQRACAKRGEPSYALLKPY